MAGNISLQVLTDLNMSSNFITIRRLSCILDYLQVNN